jgi:hypothetical protein
MTRAEFYKTYGSMSFPYYPKELRAVSPVTGTFETFKIESGLAMTFTRVLEAEGYTRVEAI